MEIKFRRLYMKSTKSIRRLTVAIVMALVLTVGGVYATFVYAQNSPVAKGNNFSSNVIADADTTEKKGEITLGTNTLQLTVNGGDTSSSTTKNHTVSVSFTGSVTATFTPAENADDDVRENGIAWKITITIGGTNAYDDGNGSKAILTSTATDVPLKSGAKSKTVTVDADFVKQYIQVTDFYLQTKAKYDAYKTAYEATTITITFSEYVAEEA